jgi:parallel beta-helix repeat protein
MMLFRTIFIWTLFLSIIPCQAATLSVGSGDSIQAAVAMAKPGDVIEVEGGTYYEHIKVDKPIILRGLNMPVLDATASGSAIVLKASGVTVAGFRIINAGSWPKGDSTTAGIVVVSSDNRITGNDVSNNFNGLLILGSNNTVTENRVAQNLGFGIRLEGVENNTIQENCLEENGQNAYDDGANLWERNYYSDFNASKKECRDEDGDGLSGFGHSIPGGESIDLHPLMELRPQ